MCSEGEIRGKFASFVWLNEENKLDEKMKVILLVKFLSFPVWPQSKYRFWISVLLNKLDALSSSSSSVVRFVNF